MKARNLANFFQKIPRNPISRVLSRKIIYLGRPLLVGSSGHRRGEVIALGPGRHWPLLQMGFTCSRLSPNEIVRSCRTLFTLTCGAGSLVSVALSLARAQSLLATILITGARTFLPSLHCVDLLGFSGFYCSRFLGRNFFGGIFDRIEVVCYAFSKEK